jgi:predicted nucleotidyltransferase component of viral defense system
MKPIRKRLEEARRDAGLSWEIIEKDYILSWVLAGIAANKKLQGELIFKGGTALKKCYFGNYRFSEDLDFTAKQDIVRGELLDKEIKKSCEIATNLVQKFSPLELKVERYREKESHPGGQEAFNIRGKFPWHRQFLPKVMVEITIEEPVQIEPVKRSILHGYEEEIFQEINVYSLEEIIAEKMRAILQHFKKLEERGWTRSRARDYYDIWRILNGYSNALRMEIISSLFLEKCKVKEVEFTNPGDFFDNILLDYIAKTWEQWLGPLVPDLPPFKLVIDDLKQKIYKLF